MAGKKRRRILGRARYYDFSLLAITVILVCFGLVMLYSASAYEAANTFGDDMNYFSKQAGICAITIGGAILGSFINYRTWIKAAPVIYVLALLLMLAVQVTPFGITVNGAKRWLGYRQFSFQPAELGKVAVILMLPYAVMQIGRHIKTLKGVLLLLFLGAVQAGAAYLFTDNLSTAIIIMGISVIVIFLAHPETAPFLKVGAVLLVLVVLFLLYARSIPITDLSRHTFRMRRILTWLHPESDMTTGRQVMQGLYAVGSGGFWGKGLGNSVQKLGPIPEAQNDMIFSIICEELGVFGAIFTLALFAYLLYRLFFIAQNADDFYGTLIVSGVFAHLALQIILNVCVVLNVIPTTGVTLPFVSYGGTSILFLMFEISLALSVSRNIRFKDSDGKTAAPAEAEKPAEQRS